MNTPQSKTTTNRSLLTVLFLGVLMGALDIAIIGPALPAIQTAFAVDERAAAQGVITIAAGVGQLVSGALIGAVAASQGGGTSGYTVSYLFVGVVAVGLIFLALGLQGKGEAVK